MYGQEEPLLAFKKGKYVCYGHSPTSQPGNGSKESRGKTFRQSDFPPAPSLPSCRAAEVWMGLSLCELQQRSRPLGRTEKVGRSALIETKDFFTVILAQQGGLSPTLLLRVATPTPSPETWPAPAVCPDVEERERQGPTGDEGLKQNGAPERGENEAKKTKNREEMREREREREREGKMERYLGEV
ncbi:hypothetical protein E1301_Tti007865 [Triplophysa tibetana]|uniref:Uncharacterized protein n=1 Tax=Triplophysa tibetana TaxID=1572043 RepID=A0A5A9MXA1_9TELE|nr:hypothetical protein E1301_Tti007865 [Triplophysa tibetana]